MPRVSVIITTYNAGAYLREALDSVLAQTFADWQCIVVNDGSTDNTADLLSRYSDPRFVLIHQPNAGRGKSLNRACRAALGEYFAILDADDVCLPERLATQVSYLDDHPEIALVGSFAHAIDERGSSTGIYSPPCIDVEIRRVVTRYNPFVHSSVMVRRRMWEDIGGYDEALPCSLDYDLCTRIMARATVAIIPVALVNRRIHAGQYFLGQMAAIQRYRVASKLRLRTALRLRAPFLTTARAATLYLALRIVPARLSIPLLRQVRAITAAHA